MSRHPFFERSILNSPHEYPARHWELDASGQPTQRITPSRRRAEFFTPIPQPKKRRGAARQDELLFDERSTQDQQYGHADEINAVQQAVDQLNAALRKTWAEWEIPHEPDAKWPNATKALHTQWWQARIARQRAIDASIAAKAEVEFLYDKPYVDNKKVRVAGPFIVESLSPHRMRGVDENDELIDTASERGPEYAKQSFPQMILENLRTAGVKQAHKEGRISFTALTPWPGDLVCADGRSQEGGADSAAKERRAAIFIGPEFGTVTRVDLVAAAREARDAGFDLLIACAFNYEAHTTEFNKLADLPVLKARMNADLHMAEDLKNTGRGNLFVIFGEPDLSLLPQTDGRIRVKVNGVDMFPPTAARCAATARTALPAGLSTPITTKRASSCATPTSWVRTIPARR